MIDERTCKEFYFKTMLEEQKSGEEICPRFILEGGGEGARCNSTMVNGSISDSTPVPDLSTETLIGLLFITTKYGICWLQSDSIIPGGVVLEWFCSWQRS